MHQKPLEMRDMNTQRIDEDREVRTAAAPDGICRVRKLETELAHRDVIHGMGGLDSAHDLGRKNQSPVIPRSTSTLPMSAR